jgi:hypothetical protein
MTVIIPLLAPSVMLGRTRTPIAANTPHIVFDEVRSRSPVEMVSIVEATQWGGYERWAPLCNAPVP